MIWLTPCILITLLASCPAVAQTPTPTPSRDAEVLSAQLVGMDTAHSRGAPLTEMRFCLTKYAGLCGWLIDSEPGRAAGVGYFTRWFKTPWTIGLGTEYGSPDGIVSTSWSYTIYLERRLTKHLALGLKHRSNCSSLLKNLNKRYCILWPLPRGTQPNLGYNFLYINISIGNF